MHYGELVEQGSVETVLANLQHDYTKRLLSDVPRLRDWGVLGMRNRDVGLGQRYGHGKTHSPIHVRVKGEERQRWARSNP